jgi:hypothetical protein
MPVDHDRRIQQTGRHLETLIDQPVEVVAEPPMIDSHIGAGQTRDFIAGDEGAPTGSHWAELGYRFAVARDDERFAGSDGLDHFRVVVA